MHITLDVIKLHDSSCEEKAKSALKAIVKQANLEGILPILEIHGVKTFSNRVVYASFLPNGGLDQLNRLAEICRTELTNYQVIRTDLRAFHPHITLMKVSHKNYKVLKKIPPECHSSYEEAHFGTEHVRSIQLCSMTCEDNGYYSVLEELYFNQNNENCISVSDDSVSDDKSHASNDTSMLLGKSDKNIDRKLSFVEADKSPCDDSKLSSSDSN